MTLVNGEHRWPEPVASIMDALRSAVAEAAVVDIEMEAGVGRIECLVDKKGAADSLHLIAAAMNGQGYRITRWRVKPAYGQVNRMHVHFEECSALAKVVNAAKRKEGSK